jgi:hypothetical protein
MPDRVVAGIAGALLAGVVALGCVAEAPESITAGSQRFGQLTDLPRRTSRVRSASNRPSSSGVRLVSSLRLS